jgi:hypothetical protein
MLIVATRWNSWLGAYDERRMRLAGNHAGSRRNDQHMTALTAPMSRALKTPNINTLSPEIGSE